MAKGGKIDAYFDCNSPYSFYAFKWLKSNKKLLAEHGIEVDFHPILLGGIMNASGNQPPWKVQAKSKMGTYDSRRTQDHFGLPRMKPPPFFPIMTTLPLRCMLFIKDTFDQDRYEAQWEQLWVSYWQHHKDISKPELMKECLSRNFNEAEIAKIMEAAISQKYKHMLQDETNKLAAQDAYGAPWFIVKNYTTGRTEPFFGSDRFPFMMRFLEVPCQEFAILPPKDSRL